MPQTDPLALRHGALVSHVWNSIAEARAVAKSDPTQAQAAAQLRRIRYQHSRILKAHKTEMARQDIATPSIDGWFQPLEDTLSKAETFFITRIASTKA